MKALLIVTVVLLGLVSGPVCAHRLDEYLQATILSIRPDQIAGSLRLVPGASVATSIIADIDSDGDGVLTADEQQHYAQRVMNDISLSVDNQRLAPRLVSAQFPSLQDMQQGLGQIAINFVAVLGAGPAKRTLLFENAHRRDISVYLVNSLVPRDPRIALGAQARNETQSWYRLEFTQGAVRN